MTAAVALVCASLYVVDGDTIWCDREKIRVMDMDAPETRQAQCESELAAGYEAKARLPSVAPLWANYNRSTRPRQIRSHAWARLH